MSASCRAPDFELEFYNRRIVEVEGQLERHDGEYINVIGLEILSASYLTGWSSRAELKRARLSRFFALSIPMTFAASSTVL